MSNSIQVSTTPQGITTITISRPHRRNAVNPSTARELYAAFQRFDQDPAQKVAILTGADGAFCAGADLVELTETMTMTAQQTLAPLSSLATSSSLPPHLEPVHNQNCAPMGPSRLRLTKPLIAAIAGHAVAGGLELSLLADLRVVEEDAVFGVYCRRWGVPLIDGGTVRLQAIVGLGRALDMILTGRPVSAHEALQMGLASRVVGRGNALEEATRIAEQLVRFPGRCMLADRRSCYYAAYEAGGVDDALKFEFDGGMEVLRTEGVRGAARFAGGLGRHGGFEKL